ncbi:MAG: hypothetical protein R6V30_01270 [Paracoccaceae bacterium]
MSDVLRILIAPLAWLAAFSAVYGVHGVICGQGIETMPRALLVGAFMLTIGLQVAVLAALYAPRFASSSPFVRFVSRATGWVGLVAAVWTLFPTVVTTSCL